MENGFWKCVGTVIRDLFITLGTSICPTTEWVFMEQIMFFLASAKIQGFSKKKRLNARGFA